MLIVQHYISRDANGKAHIGWKIPVCSSLTFIKKEPMAMQVAKFILIYAATSLEIVLLQIHLGSDLLRANKDLQLNWSPSVSWKKRISCKWRRHFASWGLFLGHPTNSPSPSSRLLSAYPSLVPSKQQCQQEYQLLAWRLPAQRNQPGQEILACQSMNSEERLSWTIQTIIYLKVNLTQLLLHKHKRNLDCTSHHKEQ